MTPAPPSFTQYGPAPAISRPDLKQIAERIDVLETLSDPQSNAQMLADFAAQLEAAGDEDIAAMYVESLTPVGYGLLIDGRPDFVKDCVAFVLSSVLVEREVARQAQVSGGRNGQ